MQAGSPVSEFYQTWWIDPDGEVFDAVRRGIPGHCTWLEERYGICSREEACDLGWIRAGWNMQEFYVQGRPERIRAERAALENLLLRNAGVVRVVVDDGPGPWSILRPDEFFSYLAGERA